MNKNEYSKEEYKELKQKELNELQEKLQNGIQDALNSDKYKDFLKTMSKFYKYSYNNSILIQLQKQDATLVASYSDWKKQNVKLNKGEYDNPIKILCPVTIKVNVKEMADDMLENRDEAKTKDVKTITKFKVGKVYDISQTNAYENEKYSLKKDSNAIIEEKGKIIEGLEQVTGITINFVNNLGRANGTYDLERNEIKVRDNMGDIKTISTAIHESAHALLHNNNSKDKPREQLEFEAESVAFVVCERLGIDAKKNNFLYLANWVGKQDISEFKNSLKDIQRASNKILQELSKDLELNVLDRQEENELEM